MKDPFTKNVELLAAMLSQHAKRLRKLEVKSTPAPGMGGADTTPPTVPTGLNAIALTYHQVQLQWTASTDDVAIAGYTIYRDGTSIGTTSSIAYNDFGVTYDTAYSYTLDAFDTSGNHSAITSAVAVTTPSDSTPPSDPTGLAVTNYSYSTVDLSWIQSTDNIGVTGYTIYRNGTLIGTTDVIYYTDSGLSSGITYNYTVDAYDAAGNHSSQSASVSVTTLTIPDSTPPSTPTGLASSNVQAQQATLTWNASTDNVGVAGYTVYRNGSQINSTSALSYTDSSLLPSTNYTFTVDAYDAAGNHSGQATAVYVTTPALPVTGIWYVATDGSATNSGSIDFPWSLDYAFNGAGGGSVASGNTIYLRGGTYSISATQVVDGFVGSAGNPVHIKNYPGERVVLRNAGGSPLFSTLELRDMSYVDIYGLEFTMYNYTRTTEIVGGGQMYHILFNSSYAQDYLNFYGCYIHDSAGMGVGTFIGSGWITFNGCIFLYNGSNSTTDWTIWTQNQNDTKLFKDCVIAHGASDGIRNYATDDTRVDNLEVNGTFIFEPGSLYANPGIGIMVGSLGINAPQNIVIDNNVYTDRTMASDSDSRCLQLGDLGGSGSSGSVGPISITSSLEDGRYASDGSGTYNTSLNTLGHDSGGLDWGNWYRFLNMTIPSAATITSATLQIVAANARTTTLNTLVRCDKSGSNPAQVSDVADALSRTRGSVSAAFSQTNWALGDVFSISVTSVVQEAINQAGWASGNAIQLFMDENTSTPSGNTMFVSAYENTTYAEAQLTVNYTTSSSDVGVNTVSGTGNYFVGDALDLAGSNYTSVSFTGNTVVFPVNIGTTESSFPTNTYLHSNPATGTFIRCRTFDWDSKRANIAILNWSGAVSVTLSAADLTDLNISSGDTYELHNIENYWSDVIINSYNGSEINVPMTGRTQANPAGAVGAPATMYPYIGAFQIVVLGGGSPPPPPPTDTTAPSTPTSLAASAVSSTQIDLTWTASTDNVAVTGYTIYRGGTQIATSASPSYSNSGLSASTNYVYTVDAYDAAGNHSSQSASANATTDSAPPPPSGANWYVGPSGSSSNSGTRASPWSLSYAINGAAGGQIGAGDVVYMLGGNYSYSSAIYLSGISGTSSNPIIFQSEPGARATIRATAEGFQTMIMRTCSWVTFQDIEFTQTNYTRTSTTSSSSTETPVITSTSGSDAQTGIKFKACTFHDSIGMGTKSWYSTVSNCEWNGCLFYYNGQDPAHDHGTYTHNTDANPKLWKDCIYHNNAGYGYHSWGNSTSADQATDNMHLEQCVFFNTTSLYSATRKMDLLIGNGATTAKHPTLLRCMSYAPNSTSTYTFRVGYGGGVSNASLTYNYTVGRPWYLEDSTWSGTISNNTIYYPGGMPSTTLARINAGSANTLASVPSSGSHIFVYAYDWDSKRANIIIYNFGSASSISITNSVLSGAGVTLANGSSYELRNAENYYGDIITGTYNGSSISVPMTGRTRATPVGGISTPPTAFPKFGVFVLRNLS